MVITVNGWMNHPSGFRIHDGKVFDVHPFPALFENSYFWHELVHMYLAGFMVTGFVTAAVYAFGWLRGARGRYERTALVVPLTVAALAAPVQILVGDWAARDVARTQPIKLAAFEGVGGSEKGAPAHILGWYDGSEVRYGIPIPNSSRSSPTTTTNAEIKGLDTVNAEDQSARQCRPFRLPDDGRYRDWSCPSRRLLRVGVATPTPLTEVGVVLPGARRSRAPRHSSR